VPLLNAERTKPVPIGRACANTEVFALDPNGRRITGPGEKGELYVRGPSIMRGYWGDRPKSAAVLVKNPLAPQSDEIVYRTGDIVTLDSDGNYLYLGREDGMIKTRGYRVELGEVESILYGHPGIKEAAVIAVPDDLLGNRIRAVISPKDGVKMDRKEVISFCSEKLPNYMLPDDVEFLKSLPKTSTGKTDRVALQRINSLH
jgi:acyl-coenzyme A synthetase/AMP-(fatty) acid ligase